MILLPLTYSLLVLGCHPSHPMCLRQLLPKPPHWFPPNQSVPVSRDLPFRFAYSPGSFFLYGRTFIRRSIQASFRDFFAGSRRQFSEGPCTIWWSSRSFGVFPFLQVPFFFPQTICIVRPSYGAPSDILLQLSRINGQSSPEGPARYSPPRRLLTKKDLFLPPWGGHHYAIHVLPLPTGPPRFCGRASSFHSFPPLRAWLLFWEGNAEVLSVSLTEHSVSKTFNGRVFSRRTSPSTTKLGR